MPRSLASTRCLPRIALPSPAGPVAPACRLLLWKFQASRSYWQTNLRRRERSWQEIAAQGGELLPTKTSSPNNNTTLRVSSLVALRCVGIVLLGPPNCHAALYASAPSRLV